MITSPSDPTEATPEIPPTFCPGPPATWSERFWREARKIVIFVIGMTLILFGIAGLLLPVLPGWLTIFGGLALLATEFAWARWMLKAARKRAGQLVEAAQKQMSSTPTCSNPQATADVAGRLETRKTDC